jgi:Flp pilus assembly protein TadB
MAIHAGLGRRNARLRGIFHPAVTIAAINAIVSHVVLMAELYGLIANNILPRVIWRTGRAQHTDEPESRRDNGD